MNSFSCLAKTNFQIPNQIINQLLQLDPIDFDSTSTLARNPIYRQLNVMVVHDHTIDSPIVLTDVTTGEAVKVTPELLHKLKDRYRLLRKEWNIPYVPFREQDLPVELQETIKSFLPIDLQNLNPRVAIQSKFEKVGVIAPHQDHYRTACLFYLLQGNQEETVWWEKTEEFEEYDFFRFADVTKIKKLHSEIIQEGNWYVFDNQVWHSVHPSEITGRRTAVCIEFNNLSASELYKIIENQ